MDFNGRVQPTGRVIQFMDSNGPRSYLNKAPAKVVGILRRAWENVVRDE